MPVKYSFITSTNNSLLDLAVNCNKTLIIVPTIP